MSSKEGSPYTEVDLLRLSTSRAIVRGNAYEGGARFNKDDILVFTDEQVEKVKQKQDRQLTPQEEVHQAQRIFFEWNEGVIGRTQSLHKDAKLRNAKHLLEAR